MIMSRSKSILAAAVVGAVAFAGAAQAATVTVTPVVTRYYANDVDFGAGTASAVPSGNTKAGIYEVAYRIGVALSAADSAAGFNGLGNIFFDANQGASGLPAKLTPVAGFTAPADLGVKTNSLTAPTRFKYTDPILGVDYQNGGAGVTNTQLFNVFDNGALDDYKGISVELGNGVYTANDPRLNMFQSSQNSVLTNTAPGAPFLLGSPLASTEMFVKYDGTGPATLQPFMAPVTEGFGLHNNTTGQITFFPVGAPGQTVVLNPVLFSVPEPGSLGLLGLGSLVGLRRRRA